MNSYEIEEKTNEIYQYINENDYKTAISMALKLDRENPGSADFILGTCYANDMDNPKSAQKALFYFDRMIKNGSEDTGYAYFMGASIYLNMEDYENAVLWFREAEALGEKEATVNLGGIYSLMSSELRTSACRTLNNQEYKQFNAYAVLYALESQEQFLAAATKFPETMDVYNYITFGFMSVLLYNMACRGELNSGITQAKQSITGYLGTGLKIIEAQFDTQSHEKWWNNIVDVSYVIRTAGYPAISEYILAAGSITDSKLHKSANAFYRAKWHLMKAEEILSSSDREAAQEIKSSFSEYQDEYKKLEFKYGSLASAKMKAGEYPDISVSYPKASAPKVESCARFMNSLSGKNTVSSSGGFLSSIFGLFGKGK